MMAESELSSIEDFENVYSTISRTPSDAQKRQETTWTFLIPAFFKTHSKAPKRLQVLGTSFQMLEGESAKHELEHYKADILQYGIRLRTSPPTFWRVHVKGKDWYKAWLEIDAAYETLKGIFELTQGFGNRQFGWSIYPKSACYSEAARWIVAVSEKTKKVAHILVDSTEPEKTQTLNEQTFAAILKNAVFFKAIPQKGSTKDLLATALRLYSQALSETMIHRRLVGFWQLAELLTLSDRTSGKTDVVCERLAAYKQIFLPDGIGLKLALNEIADKRNNAVHRGEYSEIKDVDVQFLKLICETTFAFIFTHIKRIRTLDDLDLYYQFRNRDGEDLKQIRKHLAYLLKQKKKFKEEPA